MYYVFAEDSPSVVGLSASSFQETAYDSYMNPESGFRAGPGDSYDAA
jgi:hypothetical protein